VPRRLTRPDPPLSDDAISLEPLRRSLAPEFEWAAAGEPEIVRFTLIPTNPEPTFVAEWLGRYENGWLDGTRAGFAIRGAGVEAALGFAAIVALDLDNREGEIGYALPREGRGRGTATRAVSLLTRWGLDQLGLERLELRIDVRNTASERVAERCGYRRDGILRSLHVKEGLRGDVGVWSRLASD
jgi:RimJ/RimL family protein N-acetyltransferase